LNLVISDFIFSDYELLDGGVEYYGGGEGLMGLSMITLSFKQHLTKGN